MTKNANYFPSGTGPEERIDGDGSTGGDDPGNQAPSITSTSKTSAVVGLQYQYDVAANALDTNDTLTFSLDKAPTGMTINSMTGLISWTPSQQGAYSVTAKVADSAGLFDRQSFTINVSSATYHIL